MRWCRRRKTHFKSSQILCIFHYFRFVRSILFVFFARAIFFLCVCVALSATPCDRRPRKRIRYVALLSSASVALCSKLINIHAMQCGDAAKCRRKTHKKKSNWRRWVMKKKKTPNRGERWILLSSPLFFRVAFCFSRLMWCHLSHCCSSRSYFLSALLVGGHVEWPHNASIIIIQI